MSIPIVCPGCKKSFNVDDKFVGKTGPCPNCKTKITIPAKAPEVKIHAPDEFAGGGKSVTGKLLLKPIAREEARIKPLLLAVIGGTAVAAIGWAVMVHLVAPPPVSGWPSMLGLILCGAGLLLISPLLAIAAYSFLRDDELAAYRGVPLYIRAAICGLVYVILWGVFAYVKIIVGAPMWMIGAPFFLLIGAGAGKFSFDLETANGFFHYTFYVAVTMLLGAIAGFGWVWQ